MYTVYGLVDPRDYLIRYVGITDDVYRRFREHMVGRSKNPAKDAWIQQLQAEQLVFIMKSLETTESYQEALKFEKRWIEKLLAQSLPLFNIATVETPTPKPSRVTADGKLKLYDGGNHHYKAWQIDQILDHYLLTGELPPDVSDRQRYHYRHHPRLADRKILLKMSV